MSDLFLSDSLSFAFYSKVSANVLHSRPHPEFGAKTILFRVVSCRFFFFFTTELKCFMEIWFV